MEKNSIDNRIKRIVWGVCALVLMGVIFFFSVQPGDASDETSMGLLAMLFGQGLDFALLWNALARKIAHVLEYGALAVPVWVFLGTFRLPRRVLFWFSTGFCALYAVSDELHQLFVPDRSCEAADILVDSLGALAAVAVLHLLTNRVRKKETKQTAPTVLGEADRLVLDAFSSYIMGRPMPSPVPEAQLDAFIGRSAAQKILPMTAQVVLSSDAAVPDERRMALKREATEQIVKQIRKTEAFLRAYRALRKAGAAPLCVKGIVCRSLYPEPDLRISADEDLLAREEEFDRCREVLLSLGFVPEGEAAPHVISLRHPESGCTVELHRTLFPEDGGVYSRFNTLLGDLFRASDALTVNGTELLCPSPTDHLLYMILHAFKHFLINGVGIRQIADIALFAERYSIDWPAVFEICADLRLTGFLNAVLRIGSEQFGLAAENIDSPYFDAAVDAAALLRDVMAGGVYGERSEDHRRSGNVTFGAYAAALSGKRRSLRTALFPPTETMRRKYPYAAKHGSLLPAAYASRLLGYVFSRHDTADMFATAERRAELMRQYGIF
ncbi:MAG: VanZ family protein [Clostridia bacterium]|nr:VanZ family protein [Clostridia bacterium]